MATTTVHRPHQARRHRAAARRPRLPGVHAAARSASPSPRSCSGWTSSSTGSSTGRSTSRREVNDLIPGNAHQAMLAVGVIEIVAGLVVALRPKFGGYLVAAWLAGIILNLLVRADYYDVALRDFGLLLGALDPGPSGHRVRPHAPRRQA